MGGRSEGTFELRDELLHFSGDTNTNGGGFSSIRTAAIELDLSSYAGIRLRVKGDGRRYTWRLTTTARWRGRQVSYWADLDTTEGAWTVVRSSCTWIASAPMQTRRHSAIQRLSPNCPATATRAISISCQ